MILSKTTGILLQLKPFKKTIRISSSPKHSKELIKIVPGEIYDSKIKKKINKSPNGIRTFLLRILIVCPRNSYYPYEGKPKGEERMSIEIAKNE